MEIYNNFPRKLLLGMGVLVLYGVVTHLPCPEGLPSAGVKAIALMVAAVVVWSCEILPIGVSAPLFVVLAVLAGLTNLPHAMSLFGTPVIFFAFAMFCVAVAFQNSGLSRRIVLWASLRSGGSPRRLLFYLMMVCALCSTVLADLPMVAMMLPVALALLKENGCQPGRSNFGKALMLGLPFAAYIGGVGTPAGAAPNMMTIGFLESTVGLHISFFEWAAIGMPMVILATPVAYLVLSRIYPPELEILAGMKSLREEYRTLGALTVKEKRFLVILVLNLVMWSTDKIHGFPLSVVAMVGAAAYALPGLDLVDWNTDRGQIGWESLLLIGSANALGMLVWEHGAASWIAGLCLSNVAAMPLVIAISTIALFTVFVHLIIVNTAIIAIMLPTLTALAATMGTNPAALAIPMGFSVSAAYLLPLDVVCLVTFSSGYYRITDMMRPGIIVSLVWVAIMTLLMLCIAQPMGLF